MDKEKMRDLERAKGPATEVIEQAKDKTKLVFIMWFVAWFLTLAALVGTNFYWIYVFQSYDYVSQDGNGVNNYNSFNGGNTNNGTEIKN